MKSAEYTDERFEDAHAARWSGRDAHDPRHLPQGVCPACGRMNCFKHTVATAEGTVWPER